MGNVQHTALIEVNCKCIHMHVRGCIYCHSLNSRSSPLDLHVEENIIMRALHVAICMKG